MEILCNYICRTTTRLGMQTSIFGACRTYLAMSVRAKIRAFPRHCMYPSL